MNLTGREDKPFRFSVVIPLFNKEKSIGSTVWSVLKQTYQEFELIIVNDGSTDKSLDALKSFTDPRIRIIDQINGGVSSARNLGILSAINEFIIFLDADDLWLPICLEEMCRLISKFPSAGIFVTNFNLTGKNLKGSERCYYSNDYYYATAYYMAKWSIRFMITGCVTVRRGLFNETGYFDTSLTHGEDLDMWRRLTQKAGIAKSEVITTIYRTEAENRASFSKRNAKILADRNEICNHFTHNKSYKLYRGVKFLIEDFPIKSGISQYHVKKFWQMRKYLPWIILGLLFIIKVRFLRWGRIP